MTAENWQNLCLAALALFYLIQIGLDIIWHNTCGHLGIDYCAFWSAGRLANSQGYADIYNLGDLGALERSLFPSFGNPATFAVSPIAYLPVFILPFQLLSLLPVNASLWIWLSINTAVLIFYLRFFVQKTSGRSLSFRLLVMILLSLPVYWNFLEGQVNLWLTICIGEFMRAVFADKPFRAGLWLGGLLLKPQTLILIIPVLLLQRSIKTLAGLAVTSFGLIFISFFLAGFAGLAAMLKVWLGFSKGMPTNDVSVMMNWRMLATHLNSMINPFIGWLIAGAGMVVTIAAALYVWRRHIESNPPLFVVAFLGILAATGAVAWHSHVHTAMILIPPLIYLLEEKLLSNKLLNYWIFLPASIYALTFLLASLVQAAVLPSALNPLLNFLRGAVEFGFNLYLVAWALKQVQKNELLQIR